MDSRQEEIMGTSGSTDDIDGFDNDVNDYRVTAGVGGSGDNVGSTLVDHESLPTDVGASE